MGDKLSTVVHTAYGNVRAEFFSSGEQLAIRLTGASSVDQFGGPVFLGGTEGSYRRVLEVDRVSIIANTLLSRDFLLRQRILRGSSYTFVIRERSLAGDRAPSVIEDFDQSFLLALDYSDQVLPWLLPVPLTDELYSFQREGVDWLISGEHRLLADDMGLGKTVQAIFGVRTLVSALMLRRVLVLCPKSLVCNWLAEFRKWAPELVVCALSPGSKHAIAIWKRALDNSHVVIGSYEQVRYADEACGDGGYDLVVADEAHRLRNASSQVSQGVRSLKRLRFWALTGTPIERDLSDLATILSLLNPRQFSRLDANGSAAALREKSKAYVLRRTKEAVLRDLPEVSLFIDRVELLPGQASTYRRVLSGVACDGSDIVNPLHMLNELRRVCDYDPVSQASAKLDLIVSQLVRVQEGGEKAIVFSFVIEPLVMLFQRIEGALGAVFIDGSLNGRERDEAVRRFKGDPNKTVLCASSKVASEGLTLVEANHVFFINRWWNPSSNNQARDRVVRIGQKRPVFIHEYISINTIEEVVQKILSAKSALYRDVVGRLERQLVEDSLVIDHLSGRG